MWSKLIPSMIKKKYIIHIEKKLKDWEIQNSPWCWAAPVWKPPGVCLPCGAPWQHSCPGQPGLQLNFARNHWGRGGWFIGTNPSFSVFISYFNACFFSFLNHIFNQRTISFFWLQYWKHETSTILLQNNFWENLAFAKELLIIHSVGRNKFSSKLPMKVFLIFLFLFLLSCLLWFQEPEVFLTLDHCFDVVSSQGTNFRGQ